MYKFKIIIWYLLIALVFVLVGWFANVAYNLPRNSNPIAQIKPTPLAKYSIENLGNAKPNPSQIELGGVLKTGADFTSYEFTFSFDPALANGARKKVSGLINIPAGNGSFPVILMFRGYVDQKEYVTGMGTQHAAEVFAENGYITISPDFLGYGDSDSEAGNIFESRFQTYTTAMMLLSSVKTLEDWDRKNVFIWAHSNGGQIALTTLEATGLPYPTVLWAPVSKPFPYSILYYTDESDDRGKLIRRELSEFEQNYDAEKFSITNYLDKIKAPIQLNQGTNDDAVPLEWSNLLAKELKAASVSAEYIKYTGADHNFQPGWNFAVSNSIRFFKDHLVE